MGEDDADLSLARAQLGANKLIGISCYDDINRAKQAENSGADYVAFGTMFPSKTKSQNRLAGVNCIKQAKLQLSIPIVAIGGINLDNAETVVSAGADSIAVINALFAQADITAAAQRFAACF